MTYRLLNLALAAALPLLCTSATAASDELSSLAQELHQGKTTAQTVLAAYQARIQTYNPALQAVMTINPQAQADAVAADQAGRHGSLSGLPILLKDNIDARGMVTTAGSLALADNLAQKDAPLVARLRAAGAIIAGKANLSEWANLRSSQSSSGWSSAGGQTRNPYAPDSSPCGSSSGSGAAVAARLIPAAIGTETDGSIVCPASVNGLVGLKPTVGLVSRTGIVPLSHSQDTAGPMTLTVRDAAMLLNAMAGSDVHDPATRQADRRRSKDYTAGLRKTALQGVRLGIVRKMVDGYDAETRALFDRSLALLIAGGATIVDQIDLPYLEELDKDELTVLLYEFKADLNTYLASTPAAVKTRNMADVIAFNRQHADTVMPYFGQELMEQAQATPGLQDVAYRQASARIKSRAGKQGIDAVLKKYRLTALIAPTTGTAWAIDYKAGDVVVGSASTPAAIAGYPHLTVPMGLVRGLPVGLSLFAGAWSEAKLLNMGYAFEQARPALPAPALLQPQSMAR
ncbi:amidase [Undibacterium sp. CY18W]|uniref:Amidase n=1 Tax=Undibacterium hunanense TaxID=2762292 RepID=A0ABR6ZL34_9BURK|nr:amidase [Undibacterium hunanense]MBC3916621.1 amidase [Undibacterium hunanense]